MIKARYAGFLQRSLPPFWPTTDRQLVLGALTRLDQIAPPPLPVAEPGKRSMTGAVADPGPAAGARTAVVQGEGWSVQDDDELRDGVDLGLPLEELAASLDREESAVAARAQALGLRVPTRG